MHSYININARYGVDQSVKMSYRNPQEILEEMDRLGIWQTVIEYPVGLNTLHRNQKLLSDLAALPQSKERVIPSFILDTSVLYQVGAMEQVRSMMEANRPFCVTLRPKSNKFRLRAIEPVFEKVKDLDPVVLIDYSEVGSDGSGDDLVYLANRYPNMSFVIRQFAYTGFPFVFDAMYRAQNIYMDNSWLHSRDGIKMVCQTFGHHRLLFGLGPKSNCGAAMAAITFADIPEEQKDDLRWGNFIRLFRRQECRDHLKSNLRAIPNRVANRFWTPFVDEGKAPDVDIYDVHTHMGNTGGNWYLLYQTFEDQVKNFEADMKRFNIKKIVSSVTGGRPDLIESNVEMEQAVRGREDRFLGYLRYNPTFSEEFTDEYLDARFRSGYYIGMKTLPDYMGVDIRDSRYDRMFRYANDHHMPVLLHTWGMKLAAPDKCAEVARKWPNIKLILGHTGGTTDARLKCEEVAEDSANSNLFFDFCGSFMTERSWEQTLEHIDYRRVFYGTDSFLHEISWELGRLLSADIDDERMIAILGGNAKREFGF